MEDRHFENAREVGKSTSVPMIIVCNKDLSVLWANDNALLRYPSLKFPTGLRIHLNAEQIEAACDSLEDGLSLQMIASNPPLAAIKMLMIPQRSDYGVYENSLVYFTNQSGIYSTQDDQANDMILTFSNQFRGPLSNIFAALTPLGHASEESGNPVWDEYVGSISRNCYRILRTVSTVTEVAKFTGPSPGVNLRRGDFCEFIGALCDAVRILLRPEGILFEYTVPDKPIITLYDQERILLAVLHLVSNSCIYTRERNIIRLTLDVIDERIAVTVTDKGAGIPNEYLSRIFDPYFSYEQGGPRYARSGLGLTLVKHIVYAHSGTIYVNSVEHEGTVVAFTFPITDDPGAPPNPKADLAEYLRDSFSPLYIGLADICNFHP